MSLGVKFEISMKKKGRITIKVCVWFSLVILIQENPVKSIRIRTKNYLRKSKEI